MSKYTTEVRFICETKSGFSEDELSLKTVDEIISASRENIFNFVYPIYEETHRAELETKILKHYYTREICAETYGLWQLWLNEKLNLIMPKYNKLYKAEHDILNKELKNIDVDFDGRRDDDFTRTDNLHTASDFTETRNLTDTNTHHDENNRKYSDTPQGSITFAEANEEYYWLTDYTETANTGGATDTHTGTDRNAGSVDNTGTQRNAGTRLTDNNESGYRGEKIYAELISAYSEKVLNIDMMIINELKDLFFKLW